MDIETMMSGAEGTVDTGTTDTRTGEQMLADAFAEYGSGNSGEVADPADADGADATDPAGGEDGGDPAGDDTADTSGESDGQGKDKIAIYADARRRAEAKLQREREAFEKEKAGAITKGVNEQIALMGLVDPKTQKPIVDAEGMRAYRDALASKRMEQAAQSKGMTAEELNELVSLHPSVMAANDAQKQLERQQAEVKRQSAEAQLREDIAAIGKYNPDIRSFADLRSLDRFDAIYDKIVKRGYSVVDAYMTEYRDALSDARVREAEQRVRNGTAGKSHMRTMDAHGEGAPEVPQDEVTLLSRLTGKSPEDARKSLSRFHK
mgnify:CR=1 FL=1